MSKAAVTPRSSSALQKFTHFRYRRFRSRKRVDSEYREERSEICIQTPWEADSDRASEKLRESREASKLLERRVVQRLLSAVREELSSPLPASHSEFPDFNERVQVHAEQALKDLRAQRDAVQDLLDALLAV